MIEGSRRGIQGIVRRSGKERGILVTQVLQHLLTIGIRSEKTPIVAYIYQGTGTEVSKEGVGLESFISGEEGRKVGVTHICK